MTIFDAAILGVVEGLTEFLPISSTAHLFLVGDLLKLPISEFQKSFDITIQLGAILSVVVLYWKLLFDFQVIKRLLAAFVPTGLIGLAIYKVAKIYLLGNTTLMLWALFLGGILLILFEYRKSGNGDLKNSNETKISDISYKHSFLIGIFQAVAIIPGVSRSAATIIGGTWLGIDRKTIVEFSFLLAVPTMAAATTLDLYKNYHYFSANQVTVLAVGFITAFVVALLAIKLFISFIRKKTFSAFGLYRMFLAVCFGFLR